MTFDLAFYAAAGATNPTREQVSAAFASVLANCTTPVSSPGGMSQWTYKSPQTGVSCRFSFVDPAASAVPDARVGTTESRARFSGLSVEVPFVRPRFVGIESLAAAGALAGHLGLLMPDPRTPQKAGEPVTVFPTAPQTMNLMIERWMEGNRRAITSAQKSTGTRPPYLDADRSMYWWRFQSMRQGIQQTIGRRAIVSSARVIRMVDSGAVVLMADWANGFPAIFPQAEVFLLIEAKSMNDPNAKAAWSPAREVIDRLGSIFSSFEQPGCDLISCAGVPPSGPVREAFNALPRYPVAGAIEDIGLAFVDEPEQAPAA